MGRLSSVENGADDVRRQEGAILRSPISGYTPAECYRSRQSLVIWGMSAYKPPAPQRMAAIYPADSLALLALPP